MTEKNKLINTTAALRLILTQTDDKYLKYLIQTTLSLERDLVIVSQALAGVVERISHIKTGFISYHNAMMGGEDLNDTD